MVAEVSSKQLYLRDMLAKPLLTKQKKNFIVEKLTVDVNAKK